MRAPTPLVPVLAAALPLVALLADRALVGQAEATRAAAVLRADGDARLAVQSARATLAQIEQGIASGATVQGVAWERLCPPPAASVAVRGFVPYGRRPRAELADLLSSTHATPTGLPEAVVARLALGPETPVSGVTAARPIEERLLDGDLPVHPEDLPYLARLLGVGGDARVRSLQARLRRAPEAAGIPSAPTFARQLGRAGEIEGWTRREDGRLLRYALPVATLLERAKVSDRVQVVAGTGEPATGEKAVVVPLLAGLSLAAAPRLPGVLRLSALRGLLWLSAATGVVGLIGLWRALAREARAVARERAFLANVTHELRTPLAAIRVLGETLADGRGEAREYGALLAQEGRRLETLVERVLTLTRGGTGARLAPVDPAEIVRAAVALAQPRAERRGTRITCRLQEGLRECRWDGDAVRRALLNLIENGVVHGREQGRVEVAAEGANDEVRLAVSDDGPGIGRGERRRIFGRFERGRTEAPGTGLGLYLVEEVARAHGGRIDLATVEGRGATFTLVLPREPARSEPEAVP